MIQSLRGLRALTLLIALVCLAIIVGAPDSVPVVAPF
jgi:hypothetical protein